MTTTFEEVAKARKYLMDFDPGNKAVTLVVSQEKAEAIKKLKVEIFGRTPRGALQIVDGVAQTQRDYPVVLQVDEQLKGEACRVEVK